MAQEMKTAKSFGTSKAHTGLSTKIETKKARMKIMNERKIGESARIQPN